MTKQDIIRIAQDAGLHIATDVKWMPIIGLEYAEKFAALVIANHPPQSFMSWQEGYEAGKQTEREAIAKWLEDERDAPYWAESVRARGQA